MKSFSPATTPRPRPREPRTRPLRLVSSSSFDKDIDMPFLERLKARAGSDNFAEILRLIHDALNSQKSADAIELTVEIVLPVCQAALKADPPETVRARGFRHQHVGAALKWLGTRIDAETKMRLRFLAEKTDLERLVKRHMHAEA